MPSIKLKIVHLAVFFSLVLHGVSAWQEKIIAHESILYSINRVGSFAVSRDNGKTWTASESGLPGYTVYPFREDARRKLTSVSIDTAYPSVLSVTTADSVYISDNGGGSWEKVGTAFPVKSSYYFTASAVSGGRDSRILLGTSFSGLFESADRGRTWKSLSPVMERFAFGAGFYEDISAAAYGSDTDTIFAAGSFSGKIFYLERKGNGEPGVDGVREDDAAGSDVTGSGREDDADGMTGKRADGWKEIKVNDDIRDRGEISSMVYDARSNLLYVYCGSSCFRYDFIKNEWLGDERILPGAMNGKDIASEARQAEASGKRGIYLSAGNASNRQIDKYLSFLCDNGMNSVVIDFKDDRGYVTYNTSNRLAREIGAVSGTVDVKTLLEKAEQHNIYVIGRIVVFKDNMLYRHDSGKYAVRDRETGSPWGHKIKTGDGKSEQKEFWVDPYSEFVWDYNIALAHELQDMGVDEIQFDYIRFPTDGDIYGIEYTHRREGMNKSAALESFLKKAREKLSVPLSTDIYGFNAWYRMGNWNGQQIDMFADYVDVICPMFYPSHFPSGFLGSLDLNERAERIYREGSARAGIIADGRSVIRPYVQAFLIGQERKLEKPEYSQYLDMQIKGLFTAGSTGFTLWNASGSYYMVSESMPDFAFSGERGGGDLNPCRVCQ